MKNIRRKTIDIAVDAAGSQTALARELGIKPQTVSDWVSKGYVSPQKAYYVAQVSGLSVMDFLADYIEVKHGSLINEPAGDSDQCASLRG